MQGSYLSQIGTVKTVNKNGIYNGYLLTVVNRNEPGTGEIDQVYITICEPNEVKGPHVHQGDKVDRFYCISGRVAVVCREDTTGEMSEYVLEEFDNNLVVIPPYNSHAIVALDNRLAAVLSIPSEGYDPTKPYNQLETNYEGYNWDKWRTS